MNNGFLIRIEDAGNIIDIRAVVEKIARVERLEMLIVIVGHRCEPELIFGRQDRDCIAAEVRPGHGHNMNLVACDQLLELASEGVILIRRDVVKLIDCNQPVVKSLGAKLFDSKPEGGMRADEHLVT